MDGQFKAVLGSLLLIVAVLGCSKSDDKRQAAAAAAPSPAKAVAPGAAAQEAPDTAVSEETTVTVTMNGMAAAKPPTAELTVDTALPADTIERSLSAPAESFSEAVRGQPSSPILESNPLRLDVEPRPSASARINPLRTMSEPSPPAASPSSPAPPSTAPAGGAAQKAVVLDPASVHPPEEPAAGSNFAEGDTLAPNGSSVSRAIGGSARAQGASSTSAAPPADPFDEVEVFYGTDRQSVERAPANGMQLALHFVPAGLSILVTLAVGMVALSWRSVGMGLAAVVGIGASVGLAYQGTTAALAAVRQNGSEGPRYTADRSSEGRVELGLCKITIPRTHKLGEVESPSITRLEIRSDVSRHVVLQETERLLDSRFYELLQARTLASPRREVFVFIHGFNVSFEDAARRTAQIHYDLKFAGAPIFFSWPANNKFILTYPADETNVAWSVPHLKQFLLTIVKESQARSINLIAHSMGNRALTAALREIELEMRDDARLFNQVILAAPDIDAEEFRQNIAPAMLKTAKQLTLYASARDDALLASQLVHRGPRAGDAGNGLVVVPGIDTIDVTAIDSSPWGHSYYGSSDPVLNDLRALFTAAVPAKERNWLAPAQRGDLTYWIFQAARTATADGDLNR